MLTIQGSRIWYTIDLENRFGKLDTNVAEHTAPLGLTHGNGATLSHNCATIAPLPETGGSKEPAASLSWSSTSYASATPATGWQVYTMANKAVPWGIAYGNGKVWLADYGQQKLVEVDAPAEIVLTLEKTASESSFDNVGDILHYSYGLTNNGSQPMLAPFTITDDKTADEACPATSTSLAQGESITCTASYIITQADLDAGSVTNVATGHAFIGTAPIDSNQDSESVTGVQTKVLTLEKSADPLTYDSVLDVIGYSYLVKNTGNVTLSGPVTVTDDKAVVTCPAGGLAPGAEMTCTAIYTITQGDIDTGSVKNTAQAHANGTNSNTAEETVTADVQPSLYQVFLPLIKR